MWKQRKKMMHNLSHSMRVCVKGKLKKEEWTNLKYETYWNTHQGSTLTFPVATDKEKRELYKNISLTTYKSAIKTDGKLKSSILNGKAHWLQEKKMFKQTRGKKACLNMIKKNILMPKKQQDNPNGWQLCGQKHSR